MQGPIHQDRQARLKLVFEVVFTWNLPSGLDLERMHADIHERFIKKINK